MKKVLILALAAITVSTSFVEGMLNQNQRGQLQNALQDTRRLIGDIRNVTALLQQRRQVLTQIDIQRRNDEAVVERRRNRRANRRRNKVIKKASARRQARKLQQQHEMASPEAQAASPKHQSLQNVLEEAEESGYPGIFDAYAHFVENISHGQQEAFLESMNDNPYAKRMANKIIAIVNDRAKANLRL